MKLLLALLLIAAGLWTLYLVAAHAGHLHWPGTAPAADMHSHHHPG